MEVTSPRDWYLIDHWPATDSEIHPPSEEPLLLFEVANFDPGLSDAVCPAEPGGARSLPADGIAVSVTLGPASDPAGAMCRGDRGSSDGDEHRRHPVHGRVGRRPRRVRSRSCDRHRDPGFDRADRHLRYYRTGSGHPAYVVEAWSDGAMTSTLEARPSNGKVELSLRQIEGWDIRGGESIEVSGSQPVEAPVGGSRPSAR